jgi:hypothetical protein
MVAEKFNEPENTAVITTDDIMNGLRPILRVSHDADDGCWQFLDGLPVDIGKAKVVALSEIVQLDPTLLEVADLPLGWVAERNDESGSWRKHRHD